MSVKLLSKFIYFHSRKCTLKCRLVKDGQFVSASRCWFQTKNIMTIYRKQNYSRLNHQIKRNPLCIPITVPILLFHLIKTPWCRSLCARAYIYVYIHIDYICIAKYVMVASNIGYLFPFNSGSTLDMIESGAWFVDPTRGWWWSDPVDCPCWNVELEFIC